MAERALLERWFHALARAHEEPASLTFVGDSITAGGNASGGGRRMRRPSRRYANVIARGLASRFGSAEDEGWTGAGWFEVESRTRDLRFGWDEVSGAPDECGLGGHGWRLADENELRHRACCDGIDLFFTTGPAGGRLEVAIDDDVVARIDTADPVGGSGRRWSSAPLSRAWHEIRVRCTDSAGREARIDGGYFHTATRSCGVEVHVGGHNGWSTADATRHQGTIEHLALNPPDLVVWFTGTNDYAAGPGRFGHDVREAMEIVERTCPSADRVLVFPYSAPKRTNWDAFRTEAESAADDTRTELVDIHGLLGGRPPTTESRFLSGDGAHPSDTGHRYIADAILASILPPSPT